MFYPQTIALCVSVLMAETFDATHRMLPVLGMSFWWAAGVLTLSLLGYLLPNWKTLQVAITAPINVLSVLYIW